MRKSVADGLGYLSIGLMVVGYMACGLAALYFAYVAVRWVIEGRVGGALLLAFVGVPAFIAIGSTVVGVVASVFGMTADRLRPTENPDATASREARERWEAEFPEGLPEGFEFGPNGELTPVEDR